MHNLSFINPRFNLHPSAYVLYTQGGAHTSEGGEVGWGGGATRLSSPTLFDSLALYLFFSRLVFYVTEITVELVTWTPEESINNDASFFHQITASTLAHESNPNQNILDRKQLITSSAWERRLKANVLIAFTLFCSPHLIFEFRCCAFNFSFFFLLSWSFDAPPLFPPVTPALISPSQLAKPS